MFKKISLGVTLCFIIVLSITRMAVKPAVADSVKLTLASALPPKSNLELASKRYVDNIKEKTGDRVKIIHYGAGSLYNHKDMIPALAKNQVNMAVLHVAMVGRRSAELEFLGSFGAQGCWTSYEHYYRFIDQPEVRKIADGQFDQYFNAKLLGVLAYGTGIVARNDKPVKSVADYKGFKMRTSGTAQATMYKALGAVTVEMSSKELYTAVQRNTIQGFTTGISRARRSRLYEVAPYITIDPTLPYLSFWLVINKDVWKKLSPADQKLFIEEGRKLEKWTRVNAAKELQEDQDFLKTKVKLLYDMSPAEKKKLVDTVTPVMMTYSKERLGVSYEELWALLDKTK